MSKQSKSAKEMALEKKAARTGKDSDYQNLVNQQIKNNNRRGR